MRRASLRRADHRLLRQGTLPNTDRGFARLFEPSPHFEESNVIVNALPVVKLCSLLLHEIFSWSPEPANLFLR